LKELKSRCVKINSIDGTWNEAPQKNKNNKNNNKNWIPQTLKKHSNHLTFPNEMEDLKNFK